MTGKNIGQLLQNALLACENAAVVLRVVRLLRVAELDQGRGMHHRSYHCIERSLSTVVSESYQRGIRAVSAKRTLLIC